MVHRRKWSIGANGPSAQMVNRRKIFYHELNIMGYLTDLQKYVKTHHVIALVGLIVVVYAIVQYSGRKAGKPDSFAASQPYAAPFNGGASGSGGNVAQPANPAGQNEEYARVSGLTTSSYGLPPSCANGGNRTNPADLLPLDSNSQWAELNPAGGADFKGISLLKAGYHIGIDTIGSTLRNANLQERSEPPNPTNNVSPWMNSTIEPDLMRAPLEIGSGPR